jgi:4a-hydroxytetrahydrobiopterin dehydratase
VSAARLTDEQIAGELASSGWRREGDWIVRDWKLADFRAAMEFVNRVAEAAEAANHHPDTPTSSSTAGTGSG